MLHAQIALLVLRTESMRTRRFTIAATVAFATLSIACSSSKNDAAPDAGSDDASVDDRPPTPPEWDRAITRPDDKAASDSRASCKYARGAMPGETLGASTPIDDAMPIKNIVVLMQENRSFDSYFGHLAKYAGRTDIESAPDAATNPDKAGGSTGSHGYKHAEHLCFADTNHTWKGSHVEYNDGKNDGFYEANNGFSDATPNGTADAGGGPLDGERALWWYDERDIPFYYDLAKTFAIADHYHCSLLGPTWPNRMFLYAATSYGKTSNVFPDLSAYPFPAGPDAVIFDELERRHVDWNVYSDGSPGAAVLLGTTIVSRYGRNPALRFQNFIDQAKAGTLPQVSFLDAHLGASDGPTNDDEHPPAQIQVGQKLVSDIVHALWASPQWPGTVLFLTYDEHGGIYDHVPPPPACAPDDNPPALEGDDVGAGGDFKRYGFRVPFVVVSPFAKKGYVSHATYDHSSITRFIEAKFKVPAISNRDANADPLSDMFDFANPPFMTPPTIDEPKVDQTELQYCAATFGK